ncbi:hypothetical protein AVDCRST_MAG92-3154 [uncultured Coleofasciculus sp.]|uniref:Uncharacterized protein n=1 Tax=uncultured Coleofasciculus sp. TaxID=1267456 RepID=A0A6J4JDI3_9CYAN|nr:hypothetical protein AVDCRST_MAG92-3154 [uncultured Coleofasciculus sp.]
MRVAAARKYCPRRFDSMKPKIRVNLLCECLPTVPLQDASQLH